MQLHSSVSDESYKRELERDVRAGLEMARFLLQLSAEDFAQYRQHDLHVIPRGAWVKLTDQEKREAEAKGIVSKTDDYQTHAGTSVDDLQIADMEEPSPFTASAENEQPTASKDSPIAELSQDDRTWYVVRQVLDIIISSPNARLQAECFRIASGLGMLDDITETSVAEKHGLTRAAVSKRCVKLTKIVGVKPSQYMRPLHIRETYRNARNKSLNIGTGRRR